MTNKEYVINKAKLIFAPKLNVFTKLYMIPNLISINQIFDEMNQKVFEPFNTDIKGYLFFLDKVPFANGPHPCEYLFIANDTVYLMKDHVVAPLNKMVFEAIPFSL